MLMVNTKKKMHRYVIVNILEANMSKEKKRKEKRKKKKKER